MPSNTKFANYAGYVSNKIRINEAINAMRKDFVQKHKEIMSSDRTESEKQDEIAKLVSETKARSKELETASYNNSLSDKHKRVFNIEELSEEDKKRLGIDTTEIAVDEGVVNTFAKLYANAEGTVVADEDVPKLEEEFRKYFTEHYIDYLMDTEIHDYEYKNDRHSEIHDIVRKYDGFIFDFDYWEHGLTVQDGLVVKEDVCPGRLEEIYYSTPKGINDRISELYYDIVYSKIMENNKLRITYTKRLMSEYYEYALEHGIEIENEDIIEAFQVNEVKVQAIATYINSVLNGKEGVEPGDYTAIIAEEIAKKYPVLMNSDSYSFNKLRSVQKITGKFNPDIDELYLEVEDDAIIGPSDTIVYATPEALKAIISELNQKIERYSKQLGEQGKESISGLDEELTQLQNKLEAAKTLYGKYQEQEQLHDNTKESKEEL